jgi:ribosome maturation factor RimP
MTSVPSQAEGARALPERIRALAEPLAREAGLVVESVTITPAGKRRVLRVVVDLPEDRTGGVPMDAVAAASRAVSAALDSSPVMGGTPYVLEVSSPGADRPLTERRHWLRARGRLVKAGTAGGPVTGRLTAVTDEGPVLDDGRHLAWAEVTSGRIELEFGRPDDPVDDIGVDDDEEGEG